MLRSFFLLLVLAVTVSAQIPMGSTKREIINLVGIPTTTSHDEGGDREFMNYRDFTITLDNHQMTDLKFKTETHPPLSSYLLPSAKPAPIFPAVKNKTVVAAQKPVPSPSGQDPAPAVVDPSKDALAPIQAAPEDESVSTAGTGFAIGKSRIVWLVVLFVGLALVKIRIELSKRKNREQLIANFPPPPPPKQGAPQAVLAVPRRDKPAKPDPLKDGWSLDLLREIEWHRFEHVVAAYERELGNEVALTDFGSDDCIDIRVFDKASHTLKRVIQCKAFDYEPVSVEQVRLFHAAMKREKSPQGSFYTTNGFTEAAIAMGKTEPKLELVDGPAFLNHIQRLHTPAQLHLFEVAVEGEFTTPTCPSCGLKMAKQSVGRGSHADSDFWGCKNAARCRQTPIKRKQPA